jgi:hypothetical protein
MALQFDYTTDSEIDITGAYARIQSIEAHFDSRLNVYWYLGIWKSAGAHTRGKTTIGQAEYTIDLEQFAGDPTRNRIETWLLAHAPSAHEIDFRGAVKVPD